MNGLLAIAESFLERMTNPQYGNAVNDQYSLRFNQLLGEDREFAESFARLDLAPEDVGSLPTCAWPWYLQWRTERRAPLSPEFLDALFDSTDDPAVRMAVIQSAFSDNDREAPGGRHADFDPAEDAPTGDFRESGAHLQDRPEWAQSTIIQNGWLRIRVARLTSDTHVDRRRAEIGEIATYLLQLGDAESLADLRGLLDNPRTRESIIAAIAEHLVDAGLDPQTEARWRAQLGLPEELGRG